MEYWWNNPFFIALHIITIFSNYHWQAKMADHSLIRSFGKMYKKPFDSTKAVHEYSWNGPLQQLDIFSAD